MKEHVLSRSLGLVGNTQLAILYRPEVTALSNGNDRRGLIQARILLTCRPAGRAG
jgi:hypothetical protein